MTDIRIGHGYDVHKLVKNRDLILGGIKINYEYGLLGHSDADVLLHAICDALLGAAGLGDIGKHFPDTDEKYKNIDSKILLAEVYKKITSFGFVVSNLDATVIAQKPKLSEYIPLMKQTVSSILNVSEERVNIKATTEEELGFTGRKEGISSHAVCILTK